MNEVYIFGAESVDGITYTWVFKNEPSAEQQDYVMGRDLGDVRDDINVTYTYMIEVEND